LLLLEWNSLCLAQLHVRSTTVDTYSDPGWTRS